MKKEPITKNTIVIMIMMIIVGAGVITANTIVPWLGEINREIAVRNVKSDIKTHITEENNELASIVLETFKNNRGIGKSEHFNQSKMLAEILQLLKNGTS